MCINELWNIFFVAISYAFYVIIICMTTADFLTEDKVSFDLWPK